MISQILSFFLIQIHYTWIVALMLAWKKNRS